MTFLLTAGCGDDGPTLHPAAGLVTYKGKPLAGAMVTFIPLGTGAIAMGTTNMEGRFEIKTGSLSGVVEGRAGVTVSLSESHETGLKEDMTPEDMQQMAIDGKLQAELEKQNTALIPVKYSRADSSGLSVDVKSGQEEYNLTLE